MRELEDELVCHEPHGDPITPLTLSIVTARLNSRLRSQNLSARELWTQRDQFSNVQIPLSDEPGVGSVVRVAAWDPRVLSSSSAD